MIKDDAILLLLRGQRQPTFLTINESDFSGRVVIDPRFCVVCFGLPLYRSREIPDLLRAALRLPEFRTKVDRMGKVLRVARGSVGVVAHRSRELQIIRF